MPANPPSVSLNQPLHHPTDPIPSFIYYGVNKKTRLHRIGFGALNLWIKGSASSRSGYPKGLGDATVLIIAYGRTSKNRYWLKGDIVEWADKNAKKMKTKTKGAMTEAAYQKEFGRVTIASKAGSDVNVGIKFIAHHTSRAEASIYRDIKAGRLCPPIKHGRASSWPFTAVEAYAKGAPQV